MQNVSSEAKQQNADEAPVLRIPRDCEKQAV